MKSKIHLLDPLRIIACLFVMFYHYTYMLPHLSDWKHLDFGSFGQLFKYGYLGVDLFFMISGFVIMMSANSKTTFAFLKSRINRLFPTFWICIAITSIIIYIWGESVHTYLSFHRVITNMTMIPETINHYLGFKNDYIDGSYWTLNVEFYFYLAIAFAIWIKAYKYIEYISYFLLASVTYSIIIGNAELNWIPYFVSGIIFYNIYESRNLTVTRIAALALSLFNALIISLNRLPILNEQYKNDLHEGPVILYLLSFFMIFVLISYDKIKIKEYKYIGLLGLLTYPVYLLHNQIGKIFFKVFENSDYNQYAQLFVLFIIIIILSYITHSFAKRIKLL